MIPIFSYCDGAATLRVPTALRVGANAGSYRLKGRWADLKSRVELAHGLEFDSGWQYSVNDIT